MRLSLIDGANVTRALAWAVPVILIGVSATAQNLLRNPGFEAIPGPANSQGLMPSEWVVIVSTPDTYSNDDSYGLPPGFLGNFTGVLAFEGLRWVAGWNVANERFGQTLTTPLVAEQTYRLTGKLHQALRSDLNNPGGYLLLLALPGESSGTELTTIGPTTGTGSWESFDVTFVAPADANLRPLLIFDPFSASSSYPGLDDLVLEPVGAAVPALSTAMLVVLLVALLALGVVYSELERIGSSSG